DPLGLKADPGMSATAGNVRLFYSWSMANPGTPPGLGATVEYYLSRAYQEMQMMPATYANVPSSYLETASNGQQGDSIVGWGTGLLNHYSPFEFEPGPLYGHQQDYDAGKVVGEVNGWAWDLAVVIYGMSPSRVKPPNCFVAGTQVLMADEHTAA